ncbi:uncharacterized protein LOC115740159 isoform X2 [Rhodamnia argentea]|uniref:Uncharacterized protein LOC115740159 isoform X2 n=1 Tax=Rhodamnia argentea TaxID=178133 RepID=A0ABM3HQJ3_9MYRT|nr:uncharacterized protein LOC115740159 isoform X2 [Rhodamnia argentea]
MFLDNTIRRRVLSPLQPWLREQPELHLRVGIIRSQAVARNLRFDVSALNELIGDCSYNFVFKEVTIEELRFRFSAWSANAFTIDVRGVHVMLSAGELEERRGSGVDGLRDSALDDLEKTLSEIDPEGAALHDALKKLFGAITSTSRIKMSMLNLILAHCQLGIHDIHLEVQFPIISDSISCLLVMKKFTAVSQIHEQGSFVRGLVGSIFIPLKEGSFTINCSNFEIRLKRNDLFNNVFTCEVLSMCADLNRLHVVHLHLCIPELTLSFSPVDISFLLAFSKAFARKLMHHRDGKQLWKLAASRIKKGNFAPILSLHRLISVLTLWLRCTRIYEHLLLLLGYPDTDLLKESLQKMSMDIKYRSNVQQLWLEISDIEKELPPYAIAQARRVVRCRMPKEKTGQNAFAESFFTRCFQKIRIVLALIWNVVCRALQKAMILVLQRKIPRHESKSTASSDTCIRKCFIFNIDKVVITVWQINQVHASLSQNIVSHTGIPDSSFLSFHLLVAALSLKYIEDIFQQSSFIYCGNVSVSAIPVADVPAWGVTSNYDKRRLNGRHDGSPTSEKIIIWSEPAQISASSEATESKVAGLASGDRTKFLQRCLQEMWLSWQTNQGKSEESAMEPQENPFLLCEVSSFLAYPGRENIISGFWKYNLAVGKLNLYLDHSSIVSVALLLRHTQLALFCRENGRETGLSYHPSNSLNQPNGNWDGEYRKFSIHMKKALLKMLPEQHIEVGAFITGPNVHVSFRKGNSSLGDDSLRHALSQNQYHIDFDIHDIEFALSPSLESDKSLRCQVHGAVESECALMMESQNLHLPTVGDERHVSHVYLSHHLFFRANGLNAYVEESIEKKRSHAFVLNPLTFQLSSSGEYFHLFSRSVTTVSAALCGMASGFVALVHMDELYVLSQVVVDLFSAISYTLSTTSAGCIPLQELQQFMKQDLGADGHNFYENSIKESASANNCVLYMLRSTFQFNSMDLFIQKSRICYSMDNLTTAFDAMKLDEHATFDSGLWIVTKQIFLELSCEEGKLEVLLNLSGVHFVIFRHDSQIETTIDVSQLRDVILQSLNCLYETRLSNLLFTSSLSSPCQDIVSDELLSIYGDSWSTILRNLSLMVESRRSSLRSFSLIDKLNSPLHSIAPEPGHWLLINIQVSQIWMGKSSMKCFFLGAHQMNDLLFSLSFGGNFQRISCKIQGGLLVIETAALTVFFGYYASLLHHVEDILLGVQSHDKNIGKSEPGGDIRTFNDKNIMDSDEVVLHSSSRTRLALLELEVFCFDISQLSLVLAAEDKSGAIRELVIEVDIGLNLVTETRRKELVFDFSRLSVLSQVHNQNVDEDFPSSRHSVAHISSMRVFRSRDKKFILKHFGALIHVEKAYCGPGDLDYALVGRGSISGFDMNISLSEIQIFLSAVGALPGAATKGTTAGLQPRHWSNNQRLNKTFEKIVPDGAIVAIQDIDEHMYFTVEGERTECKLVGSIHYSLVGEQALFRVNYHSQRRWRSSILWFSLTSLHAKDESGNPVQLAYRQGSGFVEVSSSSNGSWALWRADPCKTDNSESDIEKDAYNQLVKHTFYLVNKKNDSAIAFVNGVPEFVGKPGNRFKFKVLQHTASSDDRAMLDMGGSMDVLGRDLHDNEHVPEERKSRVLLPRIDVKVDKVSVTIVHELLGTVDTIPLLQGHIVDAQFTVQSLPVKVRIMCTFRVLLDYFDAQKNAWREFMHPVEVGVYYRSRLQIHGSDILKHGLPISFFCKIKELNLSLTELSLDVLLFVVGELNIGGPYTVRTALVLSNLCKVENQTGANVLCQFYGNHTLKLSGKQSASVYLRCLGDQDPECAAVVSVQLALGSNTTSSIHVSYLETQAIAWRTRIVSPQDSRTYPGPYIIVDVVRKFEDGLSIVVSPLTRIQNETDFSVELQFQRPEQERDGSALVLLKKGETMDDSTAMFDAIKMSGGSKKVITSLSLGNFLFSFRPKIEGLLNPEGSPSVAWSDNIEGGKAKHLSGVFDKLSFRVRRAFSSGSIKYSFSTACCRVKLNGSNITKLHFLIQSYRRSVPVQQPDQLKDKTSGSSHLTLQVQRDIVLLPTVQVSNLLQSDIDVFLTNTDPGEYVGRHIGNQAILTCGSTVNFYADPSEIYFNITLTAFGSCCKPLKSSDWVKKLLKQKKHSRFLDIDLDFDGGKYFASLRLSRGHRGILEAVIFTPYSLKNETDFYLYIYGLKQKPLYREEARKVGFKISPDSGLILPPKSSASWYSKSNKVRVTLLELDSHEALLDLDALSGLSEVRVEIEEGNKVKYFAKFGVLVQPTLGKVDVPAQLITIVPRFVVVNDSQENIIVRQCYLEDDMAGMITVKSKERTMLQLRSGISERSEFTLFENFIRKHRNTNDDSMTYVQFHLNDPEFGWSGPICVASLGCFFLKFRRQANQVPATNNTPQYANVHVIEESSSLILQFYRPPNVELPYRIENHLRDSLLTYYQKETSDPEVLQPEHSIDYVWDDLTLPRRLLVQITGMHLIREINLDKVREWKPFIKVQKHERLSSRLHRDKKLRDDKSKYGGYKDMVEIGYEVYADGSTRVLRFCEASNSQKGYLRFYSREKIRLRVPCFTIHVLETKDGDESGTSVFTPVLNSRLVNISMDAVFTDLHRYIQTTVQSVDMEPKWSGTPFAAILRRHHSEYDDTADCMLKVALVLSSSTSNVKQVKYSSIVLQPIDLNIDEETLMRIAPFWRSSLNESKSASQQYYFDNFEIHPIKITANFLPGDSYSSYGSSQETLRSLIHSVIKVPPMKNVVVELNGVLVTHALITIRELCIRCAQHYSWYAMRAIYIAKGSQLLPPGFASIFDDLASSSLDVFFDPSHGLMKLPGFTSDTFKLISKSIGGKGFSGTRRYFGDLGKTLRTAGSNVLFAAVTEISDSVLRGAETSGFDGMIKGFHQGILNLAMEPSVLGSALLEGGPDRTIKLEQSPGVDELYIEGYLQAMLDTIYKQEYLRVRVIDNQVVLKNLPPSSSLIEEIMDRVRGFLVSKALLKGDPSTTSRPLRHLRGESQWKIGPTVMTLCEHLFVSFAIRVLKNQARRHTANIKLKMLKQPDHEGNLPAKDAEEQPKVRFTWRWGIGNFVVSGILAYVDGRLCRCIPNPIARRIVSGFLLSFLDKDDTR